MKYYKSPDNQIYAYELDGSQDDLIQENFVAITEQEADELRHQTFTVSSPVPTKEQLMAELQALAAKIQAME